MGLGQKLHNQFKEMQSSSSWQTPQATLTARFNT